MNQATKEIKEQMNLTDSNVKQLFQKCLYRQASPSQANKYIKVEGVANEFVFDKEMLNAQRHNIEALLSFLPKTFREGCSFWDMYLTNNGRQWTNSPKTMESLLALAIGIGKASYPQPKSIWWSLPGGMPYVVING